VPNDNWKIEINLGLKGQEWHVQLQTSEQGIITLLLGAYGMFEQKMRELVQPSAGAAPAGLLDDALVLLRCLVQRRLETHAGKYVKIARA
jgi:hypothetical protein